MPARAPSKRSKAKRVRTKRLPNGTLLRVTVYGQQKPKRKR